MAAPITFPPISSSGKEDRTALLAALAFTEGATAWTAADLAAWFRAHARVLGRDTPPRSASTPAPGSAPPPFAALLGARKSSKDPVSRMIAASRWQVIMTLRGLLSTPCDDRFLNAAIFSGRIRREGGEWRIEVRDGDALADVVLGLFAVDVLEHRELHQQKLCVCDTCGRISYDPAATTRGGCPEHVPAHEDEDEG